MGGFLTWQQGAILAMWAALGEAAIGQMLLTFFSGTILSGLDLVSNLLDSIALYDGTAKCLGYIIGVFAFELAFTFMTITFGIVGALVTSLLNTAFHETSKAMAEYHCALKKV